jgi:hypothetical protein
MKLILLALCIPLLSHGAAAPKPITKTDIIISYASLKSLQSKLNQFIKEHDIKVCNITWQSIKRAGIEQHTATITYTEK